MDIETEKITAHELIGLIDSGEAYLFLERINHPDKYVLYHFFKLNDVTGVFFSFVYNDVLRIHISFTYPAIYILTNNRNNGRIEGWKSKTAGN
ncbi:MAG: hypothetical protein LBS48_00970 [Treponema sp.]|nr:hypothetical protein [Treponema sp.]